MSRFIETIEVTCGIAPLLSLHQRRVEETFAAFHKPCSLDLHQFMNQLPSNQAKSKWRVVYDLEGGFEFSFTKYEKRSHEKFLIIEAPEINYQYKGEDRSMLNQYKSANKEVEPLFTQEGWLTDSTYSNLIFKQGNAWYTPSTHLLNGVQRRYLLESGRIKERPIHRDDLVNYSHFALINALNSIDHAVQYPLSVIENFVPKQ